LQYPYNTSVETIWILPIENRNPTNNSHPPVPSLQGYLLQQGTTAFTILVLSIENRNPTNISHPPVPSLQGYLAQQGTTVVTSMSNSCCNPNPKSSYTDQESCGFLENVEDFFL